MDISVPSEQELQQVLTRVLAETGVPGMSVSISVHGKQAAANCGVPVLGRDGTFSRRSRFELSCLMKLFLSLTTLELSHRGILDLDRLVEHYLPEVRILRSPDAMRIRHLLTHTSGYRGVDISNGQARWGASWSGLVAHLNRHGHSFPPGCVFNYEHSEHVLLGEIIRRVCRQAPLDVVTEMLLAPSGVAFGSAEADQRCEEQYVGQHIYDSRKGCFVQHSVPPFAPFWECSLPDATITLDDILCVVEPLLANSRGGALKFSDSTKRDIEESRIRVPRQVPSHTWSEEVPTSFGVAFGHYRSHLVGHNGSTFGQTCAVRLDLSRSVAIAVGVNAWMPHARDLVISRVHGLITGEAVAPDARPSMVVPFSLNTLLDGFSAEEVAGKYVGSFGGEIEVRYNKGSLQFDLGNISSKRRRISVTQAQNDAYVICSPVPTRIGFFCDPVGNPALMMGVHAYKRCSIAA